jgi:hypothetical protein
MRLFDLLNSRVHHAEGKLKPIEEQVIDGMFAQMQTYIDKGHYKYSPMTAKQKKLLKIISRRRWQDTDHQLKMATAKLKGIKTKISRRTAGIWFRVRNNSCQKTES